MVFESLRQLPPWAIIVAISNLVMAGISTTIDEASSRSKQSMIYPIVAFACACIALFFTCGDFIFSAYKEGASFYKWKGCIPLLRYNAVGDEERPIYGSTFQFFGVALSVLQFGLALSNLILKISHTQSKIHFSIFPLLFVVADTLHKVLANFAHIGRFYIRCIERGDVRVTRHYHHGCYVVRCLTCQRNVCPPRAPQEPQLQILFPEGLGIQTLPATLPASTSANSVRESSSSRDNTGIQTLLATLPASTSAIANSVRESSSSRDDAGIQTLPATLLASTSATANSIRESSSSRDDTGIQTLPASTSASANSVGESSSSSDDTFFTPPTSLDMSMGDSTSPPQ